MPKPTKKAQAHRVREAERRVIDAARLLAASLRLLEQAQRTSRLPGALMGAEQAQRRLCEAVDALYAAQRVP